MKEIEFYANVIVSFLALGLLIYMLIDMVRFRRWEKKMMRGFELTDLRLKRMERKVKGSLDDVTEDK